MNRLSTVDVISKMKIGDRVTSDFYEEESQVIRRIVGIKRNSSFGSGYSVATDGGGFCECCKKPAGRSISFVDGAWFIPVEDK